MQTVSLCVLGGLVAGYLLAQPAKMYWQAMDQLKSFQTATPEVLRYEAVCKLIEEGKKLEREISEARVFDRTKLEDWDVRGLDFLRTGSPQVMAEFRLAVNHHPLQLEGMNPANRQYLEVLQGKINVLENIRKELDGLNPDKRPIDILRESVESMRRSQE